MSGGHLINVDTKGVGQMAEAVERVFSKVYEPFHVRRMAKAGVDAALTQIEGSATLARAVGRLQRQEERRQRNLDAIKEIAASRDGKAAERPIDEDWLWRFINLAKDVGTPEVQNWWGRMLAGELAEPGVFSPRTLVVLSQLGRDDADLFLRFLSFVWEFGGSGLHFPVYGTEELLKAARVFPIHLMHLQDVGLVGNEVLLTGSDKVDRDFKYFGSRYLVKQPGGVRSHRLTQAGNDLRRIAEPAIAAVYPRFVEHVTERSPRIPLSLPALDVVRQQALLRAVSEVKKKGQRYDWARRVTGQSLPLNVGIDALHCIADEAERGFVAHRIDFSRFDLAIRRGSMGSSAFWALEARNRITEGGRDPADWEERRELVHLRDEGRCKRCGFVIKLELCHIHHIVRRSDGGGHEFTNLVTLCKDCHILMPGHDFMRGIDRYFVSNGGVVHAYGCRYRGRTVRGTLPKIIERYGVRPCGRCHPWNAHKAAVAGWRPMHIRRARRWLLSAVYDALHPGQVCQESA